MLRLSAHTVNIAITGCIDDVEMESQLAEEGAANESKESCAVIQEGEGACPQGGEGQRGELEETSQDGESDQEKESAVAGSDEGGDEGRGGENEETVDEEDEMSQDEGDNIQTPQEDAAIASDDQPGDEGGGHEHGPGDGKTEPTDKEEQQPTQEGEDADAMSQEDATQTETEPPGDEWGVGAGPSDVDKGTKVEEMASQGSSSSDTDSDSEPHNFKDYTTLKEFGYHFKNGIVFIGV